LLGGDRMAVDPMIPPKGPVARIVFTEYNLLAKTQPPPVRREVIEEFNDLGQKVTQIEGGGPSQIKSVMTYQDGHVISQEYLSGHKDQPLKPDGWNRWVYDIDRLIDFRQGFGDRLHVHYTNFKYDAEGRLTGNDYRGGPDDVLGGRVEYRYAKDGKTITTLKYYAHGVLSESQVLTLDETGQIVELVLSKLNGNRGLKRAKHIRFRYDVRGRLIEQDTDPFEIDPSSSEWPPAPGKVLIAYDDAKGTREISYTYHDEHIVSKVRMDESGAIVEWSGGPPLGEVPFESHSECTSDTHGNWTECKQWGIKKGERELSGWWTRAITYR
jgi:hypothetical protein